MPTYSSIISGTGSFLPEKRLTNEELSKLVDTTDEWIVQRTGIKERRIAGTGEYTSTLASKASMRALKSAGLEPKDIDLIICATASGDMLLPSTACFVAASLGMDRTPAFDVSAACSGFLYAVNVANAFIRSGQYKHVLVVGAETLSRIIDYSDRSSCILFGDGAGAVVMSRSEDITRGVLYSSMHADGTGADFICCDYGSRKPLDIAMIQGRQHFMKVKGREVYKFAVQRFNELIDDAFEKCNLTVDKIKMIIPHQVNQRIIDSAMERLNIPSEKSFVNIDKYGNTSAASVPIALDEAVKAGKLVKGDIVVFVAFGAGLTWSNAVVRM
jgi:3-oxoacyl-[acyl-carrier-protein] synthase-3